MKFIIDGVQYEIESLSPDLDNAFLSLHGAFLSNQPLNWDIFKILSKSFFDEFHSDHNKTGAYFRAFTIIWRHFFNSLQWDKAENVWKLALEATVEWEYKNPNKRIHKGSPYYFWGMTALKRGDIDHGFALIHQALVEDISTHNNDFPNTPAMAFATMNFQEENQASREWVLQEALYLDDRLKTYRAFVYRELNIITLNEKYLRNPPNLATVYLLSYTISRLMGLDRLPFYVMTSSFSGQLFLNLLFDLILVINNSISHKNPDVGNLRIHIHYLSTRILEPLSIKQLGYVNGEANKNFAQTLGSLLDNTFLFDDGTKSSSVQNYLMITYVLRNHGAHEKSRKEDEILWERFIEIRNAVFNSFFLSVDYLY